MSNPDILDRDHLARYTLGDAALEAEVLDLFIGQMPTTLSLLRGSQSPRDWVCAAHSIKGAARTVGAWKLAQVAELAEQRAESAAQWEELADVIGASVDEVRRHIAALELAEA